jgi:hypothetical protein
MEYLDRSSTATKRGHLRWRDLLMQRPTTLRPRAAQSTRQILSMLVPPGAPMGSPQVIA